MNGKNGKYTLSMILTGEGKNVQFILRKIKNEQYKKASDLLYPVHGICFTGYFRSKEI
jgi:hypothetical protein